MGMVPALAELRGPGRASALSCVSLQLRPCPAQSGSAWWSRSTATDRRGW